MKWESLIEIEKNVRLFVSTQPKDSGQQCATGLRRSDLLFMRHNTSHKLSFEKEWQCLDVECQKFNKTVSLTMIFFKLFLEAVVTDAVLNVSWSIILKRKTNYILIIVTK